MCQNMDNDGAFQLDGIVSWGISGCVDNKKPTVFARTTQFISWAYATTQGTVIFSFYY